MAQQTLLDIAKLTGNDAVVGLIEENLSSAPEVSLLPARTIRGTSFKTVTRKSFPTVAFREANAADTPSKSEFDNKLVECFILSSLIVVDKAVALAYEDGVDSWRALEASGVMRAALQTIGKQVYYGTGAGGGAKGFPGLVQIVNSSLVQDAGGTTAATGSSVYLIRRGGQDVQLLFGNGRALDLSEWREETQSNIPSYVSDLTGWIGLQCVNINSVARIKKLTEDAGKGLTDALIAKALAKFPVGNKPDLILMSRRSARQLQESRTVVIQTGPAAKVGGGIEAVAPSPDSAFGIPIAVTDSILDTEALTL